MLDYSIKIDEQSLPKRIQDVIVELHRLDKEDDWLGYSLKAEEIEIIAKSFLIEDIITKSVFEKICLKYCGYEV